MPRFKNPRSDFDGSKGVWLDNDYKLKDGKLYNLMSDKAEKTDIASAHPERTAQMKAALAILSPSAPGVPIGTLDLSPVIVSDGRKAHLFDGQGNRFMPCVRN